ncbi:MAG: hypothetical protein KJO60_11330 [Desulfofustis sp.]|nr:hypothetical protein [Desulfofustis sp.]
MAKTITISLPDEIYNRLQIYKDKVNVPAVCQEAILAEIKKEQIAANGDVFDFLSSGEQDAAKDSMNMGRGDAQACFQKKLITHELMYSLWDKFRSDEAIDNIDHHQVGRMLDAYNLDLFDMVNQLEEQGLTVDRDNHARGFVAEIIDFFEDARIR